MAITEKTYKTIWGQCSARCCLCRKVVINSEEGKVPTLIGEVAHIVGENEMAARGQSNLTPKERDNPDNLLLLCREHHKIVDDDPTKYTVDSLHNIKSDHLLWIMENLSKTQPWKSALSQFTYINVPRLCEQSELQGYQVDLSKYQANKSLNSLGWNLNHVMAAFQTVLDRLIIGAVPIGSLSLHEGYIGVPISFDRQRFRTKNIPAKPTKTPQNFTGDLNKDPHIYITIGGFRLVLFIDPNWITTSTAFALFRPPSGQSIFTGLGRVTGVDYESRVMTVTPWVIGLPNGMLELHAMAKAQEIQQMNNPISTLDAMVDITQGKIRGRYFTPPPEVCDLCRKRFTGQKYMIDGMVKDLGGWACMCAACFAERGTQIGCGSGQLYLRDEQGWLEVAGFMPIE